MKATRAAAAAALALCCSGAHCGEPVPRPAGGPATAAEALARIERRAAPLTGVRGFARIEAYQQGKRYKVTQVVVAERPGKLRVETLSPFDQPLSYLATDGERLQLYLLGEQRYLTGAATADNVGRLFPVALAPRDLVRALLGGLPLPPGAASLTWDGASGVYRLTVTAPGGGQTRAVLAADLTPREVHGDGWSLELSSYEEEGPLRLPLRLRFLVPDEGADVSLRWEERELNPVVPPEAWTIDVPAGVSVETLDDSRLPSHTDPA